MNGTLIAWRNMLICTFRQTPLSHISTENRSTDLETEGESSNHYIVGDNILAIKMVLSSNRSLSVSALGRSMPHTISSAGLRCLARDPGRGQPFGECLRAYAVQYGFESPMVITSGFAAADVRFI